MVLIDHFNGVEQATAYLRAVRGHAVVSVVTRAEVLVGFSDDEVRARARPVLDALPLLEITRAEADEAARLRRAHRWKLPDAFQAALARRHGLHLATRNTKDFDPGRHDFVTVPYTL